MSNVPLPARSYPFNATPLTEPVDKKAAREYVRRLKAEGRITTGRGSVATIGVAVVVGVVMLMLLGMFGTMSQIIASSVSGGTRLSLIPIVGIVLVTVGVIATLIFSTTGSRAVRWYRLDRFAQANGMQWFPLSNNPPLPGMIFSRGSSRRATDILRGDKPRFVEFGNYQYTTGSGKNQTTHKWGYVAVHLSTPLPHIVLDALSNNGLFGSNLPVSFGKDQRLSLEGDFDRYFSLYCPRGYETDALYLFTPDIMARFIDNAAALDVEIVDDWMFLYAKRDFSTLDPSVWAWLFSVVGAFLDKFAQWERWRDDRLLGTENWVGSHTTPGAAALPMTDAGTAGAPLGAPTHDPVAGGAGVPFVAPMQTLRPPKGVAREGRRLKSGVSWGAIVIIVVVILGFMLNSGILTAILR